METCRPRRDALPVHACLAAYLIGIVACSAPTDPRLGYIDLIAEERLHTPTGAAQAGLVGCADKTWHALTLSHGATLEATVRLGDTPTLVIGGCREAGAPPALMIQIARRFGLTKRLRIPLGGEAGPFRTRLYLDGMANTEATLRIEPHFTAGTVFLEDLYISQRVERPPTPSPRPLGILLISVDTLRADAIAALGGAWATPHLDQLAAEGEAFADSWAAASWTKPSHGSLLTGELPRVHGAMTYRDALHPAQATVAERLAAAGFDTAAVVQDIVHLDPRFGFDRGFGDYRVADWSIGQMARHAAEWIGARSDRPFFFFLHTFETHSDFRRLPYEAPSVRQSVLADRFGLDAGYGCESEPAVCASERLDAIRRGTVEPVAGEPAVLRFLYGESVRHTDAVLGRLFDDLRALGVWDDLLVVLTSDHGELLLEQPRQVLHGVHHPAVLRVPLIVKWPTRRAGSRRAGHVREEPVSSLDIVPTILATAGLDPSGLPGSDLSGRLEADRAVIAGTDTVTLVLGRHMLTRNEQGAHRWLERADDDTWVPAEPDEGLVAQLARMLAQAESRRVRLDHQGRPETPPLTEEERDRLRAFGYTDS